MAQFNSFDELENNKSKWTLDSDQKLLNTLQSTSEKTLTNIKKLCDNFQASEDAVSKSMSKVDNLMTSVLLLSNTKFIENRVYDEDINEIQKCNAPAFQSKNLEQSKSQVENAFLDNLKSSIVNSSKHLQDKLGLKQDDIQTLDKINLVNNLYRNNDPFSKVPLPYLIGSEDFIKATFVGLKSSPDNSPIRLTEHSNAFDYNNLPTTSPLDGNLSSTISNHQSDEDEIFHGHQSFIPRASQPPTKPKNNLFNADDEDDEDDDLFSTSIVRSRGNSVPKVTLPDAVHVDAESEKEPIPDMMSQLAAQIKNRAQIHNPVSPSSSSGSLVKDNSHAQQARSNISTGIKPSIFPKAIPKSIFDSDQDSDDDLFSKPSTKTTTKSIDNKSDCSLKSDSVSSFNASTPTTTTNSNIDVRSRSSASSNSTLSTDANLAKSRMKSIFSSDDENDDDDGIFSSKKKSTAAKKFLFDSDDDDDLFGRSSEIKKTKQKTVEVIQDSTTIQSNSIPKVNQSSVPVKNIPAKTIPKSALFDDNDDDDDDLFGNKIASTPNKPEVKNETKENTPVIKSSKKPLFSSNVINELNTKFASKLTVNDTPQLNTNSTENEPKTENNSKAQQTKLLEDKKINKINNKFTSLFDDDDDDDDLFGSVKGPTVSNKTVPQKDTETVVQTLPQTSKVNENEFPNKTHTDHKEQQKVDEANIVTQNDSTLIYRSDDKDDDTAADDGDSAPLKDEPNRSSAIDQQTPQKSMFSTNFLSELNSTLARKNPLTNDRDSVTEYDVNKKKTDEDKVEDLSTESAIFSGHHYDEHFKILKSKPKVNAKRTRKRPSRGHFTKLASSQIDDSDNSAFDDSVLLDFNQTLSNVSQDFSQSDSIADESKEHTPSPVALEIDIEITLPTQSKPAVAEIISETVPEKVVGQILEETTEKVHDQADIVKVMPAEPKTVLKKSLFDSDDSDSDLFGSSKNAPPTVTKPVSLEKSTLPPSTRKPSIPSNLFGSDSDDEEDIKPSEVAVQTQKRLAAKKSIFDDDSDDDLFKS